MLKLLFRFTCIPEDRDLSPAKSAGSRLKKKPNAVRAAEIGTRSVADNHACGARAGSGDGVAFEEGDGKLPQSSPNFTLYNSYVIATSMTAGAQQAYIASELAPNVTTGTLGATVRLPPTSFASARPPS